MYKHYHKSRFRIFIIYILGFYQCSCYVLYLFVVLFVICLFSRMYLLSFSILVPSVSAGFPSPAEDYIDSTLDLNTHLIENPAATFFLRVSGDSMTGAGIHSGDLLLVDRSLTPKINDIVIATIHNEFTVKRLGRHKEGWFLQSENPDYPCLDMPEDSHIWGVVKYSIRDLK